jgi:hypothetical protein
MTFIIAEDKALRTKLQGMTVSDQKADGSDIPRTVGVWFGQPDQEIRSQSYPYITIDMIDLVRDTTREYRSKVKPEYLSGPEEVVADDWQIDTPIPVYIDYQVTTYARHPRHDRQLLAQLLGIKLPIRFGILDVIESSVVDGDETTNVITTRRLDVMSVSKRDATEQAKRLFVNAITVRISSEIPLEIFEQLYAVSSISIDNPSTVDRGGFVGVGPITISPPPVTP